MSDDRLRSGFRGAFEDAVVVRVDTDGKFRRGDYPVADAQEFLAQVLEAETVPQEFAAKDSNGFFHDLIRDIDANEAVMREFEQRDTYSAEVKG
jgi:hypothetical protein